MAIGRASMSRQIATAPSSRKVPQTEAPVPAPSKNPSTKAGPKKGKGK